MEPSDHVRRDDSHGGPSLARSRDDRLFDAVDPPEEVIGRSGIERGIRNPTIVVLETIAQALGVSSAKLLEDVPEKWGRR